MMSVTCLANQFLFLLSVVWWMVWGICYEQFVKTALPNVRVIEVGTTFTLFPSKPNASLPSFHLLTYLYMPVYMDSFIHLFIWPTFLEYLAVSKMPLMQR